MLRFYSLLALYLLASVTWATVITFDATVDLGTGSVTSGPYKIVKEAEGVTVTVDVTKGVANGAHYRIYKNNTATITTSIGAITQVVFECTASGEAQYGPGCFIAAPDSYSYEGNIGIWTGLVTPVVFTAATNQVRATKIIVTVDQSFISVPIITPTTGTYYAPIEVNITCATPGAKIYYTTNGTTPTTNSNEFKSPFIVNTDMTIKAISVLECNVSSVSVAEYQTFNGIFFIDNILYIGSGVTSIKGLQVNPSAIYSFAVAPPECDENTFISYNAPLHVPGASFTDYFMADYWNNFWDIRTDAVPPASVTLSSDVADLIVGHTKKLSATVSPNDAIPRSVIWTSTDQQIATVSDGTVTAKGAGECDIIAYCLDKQATCHVTVVDPISVTLDQTEITIEQTSQVTLTATIFPDDSNAENVIWSTSDANVAIVDNGVVTAVGLGECDITASYLNKQAVCHVIVVEATIRISLDKREVRVLPNHMITLNPLISPLPTELEVTSSDSNIAVARIVNGVVQVAGRSEGTTMIVVGSADGKAVPDTCEVTVYTELGDVNCDGYVSISDITSLIDYLLGATDTFFKEKNADTDRDGYVNISDLTMLIDYLLGGFWPWEIETFTINGVAFNMVAVEGGTFTMGATVEQGNDAYDNEYPPHQVTLSSYQMGQTEVTQALWLAVMDYNPSSFSGNLNRPVECVCYYECQEFINRLRELTGLAFRLPTEAEWEFAARGGNKSLNYRYSGSNDIGKVAWYLLNLPTQDWNNENWGTQPVATKESNELGLFDMSGNVSEWCAETCVYYSSGEQYNPIDTSDALMDCYRIIRGGDWNDSDVRHFRVSYRDSYPAPYSGSSSIGLRLAL